MMRSGFPASGCRGDVQICTAPFSRHADALSAAWTGAADSPDTSAVDVMMQKIPADIRMALRYGYKGRIEMAHKAHAIILP